MNLRSNYIKNIALGGVLAGVAIVIMCLGGLIPFATYACPVLCILIGNIVLIMCGVKFGWSWYMAVSILSFMLAPDRESAIVYAFLGAYPCIKRILERLPLQWIWKFLYFNAAAVSAFWVSAYILGITELLIEFQEIGIFGLVAVLMLSNVTFWLLDCLLSKPVRFKKH